VPQGYCLKERKKVEIKDPEPALTSNGRKGIRGTCPHCGAGIFRMGADLYDEVKAAEGAAGGAAAPAANAPPEPSSAPTEPLRPPEEAPSPPEEPPSAPTDAPRPAGRALGVAALGAAALLALRIIRRRR
jgi:hypothetical protein